MKKPYKKPAVISRKPRIEVVSFATGEVVHTVPLAAAHGRIVERIHSGLLQKLDLKRFYTREVDVDAEEVTT